MTKQALTKSIGKHLPIHCRTIVLLRENCSGKLIEDSQSIVLGQAPATDYTRAYGPEVYVATIYQHPAALGRVSISRKNRASLWPMGRAKRIPEICRTALQAYKARNGGL
jgi:hypothetical protein